jgi:Na+/proline symporter
MRDGVAPRYVNRLATLTLRQRAVAVALASAACCVGDALVAPRGLRLLGARGVAACLAAAAAVAVADYLLRARRRLATVTNDPNRLAERSEAAYLRSGRWTWLVAGLGLIWYAVRLPARVDTALDLCFLTFCAVGFAFLAVAFWRAGARGTR